MRKADSPNLPFNFSALQGNFIAVRPGEPDSGEPGIWIVFRENDIVLNTGNGFSFIEGEKPGWLAGKGSGLLIGKWHGRPVRLLELEDGTEVPAGHIAEPLLSTFFHARLADDVLTLAGLAQQILFWNRKNSVCSLCGGSMKRIPGTWGWKCLGCGHEHFPHIHPCTIVLVSRGDELLLIRKPEWPEGYYSIPSGFCDFGESLEECARREVEEETGIRIRNLRYVGSQSWPFPGQLMIGFIADYEGGDIIVERGELEDAAWFRRDSMPPTFSGGSIAGWIMDTFGK